MVVSWAGAGQDLEVCCGVIQGVIYLNGVVHDGVGCGGVFGHCTFGWCELGWCCLGWCGKESFGIGKGVLSHTLVVYITTWNLK